MFYLPCSLFRWLSFKKKVSYRARIIFTSDQEVMHVVHDTKFVVRVFLSGCYFHLYMHTYRSRLISIKCDKIISFCYKNVVYSMFDVDYIIIEAPSLRLSVGSLYFHYVANYFVVCISLCGEFSG